MSFRGDIDTVSSTDVEVSRLPRVVLLNQPGKLLELPAYRRSVIEKGRCVASRQASRLRYWIARQALEVTPLDQEDVIDQLSDGREPPFRLQDRLHGFGTRLEPAPPFVPFVVRVTQELVVGEVEGHAVLTGPEG